MVYLNHRGWTHFLSPEDLYLNALKTKWTKPIKTINICISAFTSLELNLKDLFKVNFNFTISKFKEIHNSSQDKIYIN